VSPKYTPCVMPKPVRSVLFLFLLSNLRSQLQQALPQLQALVSLRLFGKVAHDDVLRHVSSLLRLQDLTLVGGMLTLASFQQLPQSLTHLSISWASSKRGGERLSPSTAPCLCALTGLQSLELHQGTASLELLGSLTSLYRLGIINNTRLWEGASLEGPGSLSVLTALTRLTYMVLPPLDAAVMPSHQDLAAVTALPQLQVLDISKTSLPASACRHLFAAGRQLSQLTELRVGLDLIPGGREASLVAACCPNLASIALHPPHWQNRHEVDLANMLAGLQPLQHLTTLSLATGDLDMIPKAWGALGRLAQLQNLKVRFELDCNIGLLESSLKLSSLQKLGDLDVVCIFKYPKLPGERRTRYEYQGNYAQRLALKLTSKQVRIVCFSWGWGSHATLSTARKGLGGAGVSHAALISARRREPDLVLSQTWCIT
jgi:hypothetical protein